MHGQDTGANMLRHGAQPGAPTASVSDALARYSDAANQAAELAGRSIELANRVGGSAGDPDGALLGAASASKEARLPGLGERLHQTATDLSYQLRTIDAQLARISAHL